MFFKTVVVNYIDEESMWYKTPWRTIPDGGFLLNGGVHTIASLRLILPYAFTHLSGFASLHKDYLIPHDTIHVIVKAGNYFTGTVGITFASPTQSRPVADNFVITGTNGWISVNIVDKPGSTTSTIRILIKTVIKVDGKPEEEKEEIVEIDSNGIVVEQESFFKAISGNDDGFKIGDPVGTLYDVAFIEAALKSNGQLLSLSEMVGD